ncbi:hypothetical protein BC937DRAFT_92674 [Endogone sp. FLAS-F59071]|nr:hypothetical protein BC937DRAFT_92674 [Endogone sp. FLAS-F59071]|eukprot:RUS15271.1 hypothetical protein BC937DRAFT_92674 [Endogone sp. FLAS-F59071]
MSSHNPIPDILNRTNLAHDKKLAAKAQSLFQQATAKVPSVSFRNAGNAMAVACIQLACEALHHPFQPALPPHSLATCSATTYSNILQAIRQRLGIQLALNFESLAVMFGCTTVLSQCDGLWTTFQERYLRALSAAQANAVKIELEKPVWRGATFWVCCKAIGIRINKLQLLSKCACGPADLNRPIKTIEEHCEAELTLLKKEVNKQNAADGPARAVRKRKKKDTEAAEVEDNMSKVMQNKEEGEDRENEKRRKEEVVEEGAERELEAVDKPEKRKRGWPKDSVKGKGKGVEMEEEEMEENGKEKEKGKGKGKGKRKEKEEGKENEKGKAKAEGEVPTKGELGADTADYARSGGMVDLPSSGIVSMIPHQSYKSTKRYVEYLTWREETIQRLKNVTGAAEG